MLDSLKAWAGKSWNLVGNFSLLLLGGALILIEFKNMMDAERVWRMGCCSFDGKKLHLDWWSPEVDCFKEGVFANKIWVRVIGLLVHLWGKDFFKREGDACGGFVAVDVDAREMSFIVS